MSSSTLPSEVDLFVSYAHADDDSEGGRIRELARHIEREYEFLSASQIRIFVDRTSIEWGERWEHRIDDAVLQCRFFVPIVTPRYLQSHECRSELFTFVANANTLGEHDLLLPIIYAESGRLDESSDELAQVIAATQWIDWTQTRLCEVASSDYRRAVNDLAKRIVGVARRIAEIGDAEANTALIEAGTRLTAPESGEPDSGSDEPGLRISAQVEVLADAENAMQRLLPEMEAMASCTDKMITIARKHSDGLSEIGSAAAFTGEPSVMGTFAAELIAPISRLDTLAGNYARDLLLLEPMVLAAATKLNSADPKAQADALELSANVKDLRDDSRVMLVSMGGLLESIDKLGKQSRELRPPTTRLRSAVQSLSDGQDALAKWLQLLDSTDTAAPSPTRTFSLERSVIVDPLTASREGRSAA